MKKIVNKIVLGFTKEDRFVFYIEINQELSSGVLRFALGFFIVIVRVLHISMFFYN